MILIIDNYDSFTYNLAQYCGELGADVRVYRNDQINLQEIINLSPKKIIISPGPCTPNEAGISLQVIKNFAGIIPILGVCLGHQSIIQAFGGSIIRSHKVMHGKTSKIFHNNQGVFTSLTNPFIATRYHSLIAATENLPACFEISAWTEDECGNFAEIMGVKHKTLALEGVQFHPESILTEYGNELLGNFLGGNTPVKISCNRIFS